METAYHGRVFVWGVHEVENLVLQPAIVFETLKWHDQLGSFETEDHVLDAIRTAATELREWIAADWVRWEIHQGIKRPSGHISATDALNSLREYGQRVRESVQRSADCMDIDKRYESKVAEIGRLLKSDLWLQRLPGKQILARFLSKHTALEPAEYLRTAVSTVLAKGLQIPEIKRLTVMLQMRIGGNGGTP